MQPVVLRSPSQVRALGVTLNLNPEIGRRNVFLRLGSQIQDERGQVSAVLASQCAARNGSSTVMTHGLVDLVDADDVTGPWIRSALNFDDRFVPGGEASGAWGRCERVLLVQAPLSASEG